MKAVLFDGITGFLLILIYLFELIVNFLLLLLEVVFYHCIVWLRYPYWLFLLPDRRSCSWGILLWLSEVVLVDAVAKEDFLGEWEVYALDFREEQFLVWSL